MLVVDDEPMVCAHLRTILGAADDIEVVADGVRRRREAVERGRRATGPTSCCMDLRMPGVDGLTAIGASPSSPRRRRSWC